MHQIDWKKQLQYQGAVLILWKCAITLIEMTMSRLDVRDELCKENVFILQSCLDFCCKIPCPSAARPLCSISEPIFICTQKTSDQHGFSWWWTQWAGTSVEMISQRSIWFVHHNRQITHLIQCVIYSKHVSSCSTSIILPVEKKQKNEEQEEFSRALNLVATMWLDMERLLNEREWERLQYPIKPSLLSVQRGPIISMTTVVMVTWKYINVKPWQRSPIELSSTCAHYRRR